MTKITEKSLADNAALQNLNAGNSIPFTKAVTMPSLSSQSISATNIYSNGLQVATLVDPQRTTLSGNGILSTFAINGAGNLVNPSALIVAIDGIFQEPSVDYTVSGGNITFTSPLPSGSKAVVVSPVNTIQVGQVVPSDGSVTSAKIAGGVTLTSPTINSAVLNNCSGYRSTQLGNVQTVIAASDLTRNVNVGGVDPVLVVALSANKTYMIRGTVRFSATGGAQNTGSLYGPNASVAWGRNATALLVANTLTPFTTVGIVNTTANASSILDFWVIITTTASGNFGLTWTPVTAGSGTRWANSFIEAVEY